MNQDYKNFGERMGSFEDTMDISGEEVFQSEIPIRVVTRNRGALTSEELKHFGIPGMKWGHRKSVNATTIGAAARTGQTVTNLGQTINKSGSNKKSLKEARNLSDDDLKRLTSRLNLENNYVNAKTQQSGKSKVEGILSIAGGVLATASSAAILYDTIKKFK